TQVYEMAVLFALGWALDRMLARGVSSAAVCRLYLGVLASERFVMELYRGDTLGESVVFGLTFAQTICAALALGCLAWTAVESFRSAPEGNLPAPVGTLRAQPRRRASRNAKIRVNA